MSRRYVPPVISSPGEPTLFVEYSRSIRSPFTKKDKIQESLIAYGDFTPRETTWFYDEELDTYVAHISVKDIARKLGDPKFGKESLSLIVGAQINDFDHGEFPRIPEDQSEVVLSFYRDRSETFKLHYWTLDTNDAQPKCTPVILACRQHFDSVDLTPGFEEHQLTESEVLDMMDPVLRHQ